MSWRQVVYGVVFIAGLWSAITLSAAYGAEVAIPSFLGLILALIILGRWSRSHWRSSAEGREGHSANGPPS